MLIISLIMFVCLLYDLLFWRVPRPIDNLRERKYILLCHEEHRLYLAPFKWAFLLTGLLYGLCEWFYPIFGLWQFINREGYIVCLYGVFLVRIVNSLFFKKRIQDIREKLGEIEHGQNFEELFAQIGKIDPVLKKRLHLRLVH